MLADNDVNAGVRAQQGFALQRNMALFIILDNFDKKFGGTNYFLSLEHLEDILFCFVDNHGHAVKVETYQSKKKSGGSWSIDSELAEIIVKILKVGKSLIQEQFPKCHNYEHNLFFSSNTSMQLKKVIKIDSDGKAVSKTYSEHINEENSEVNYSDLDQHIQNAITSKLVNFDDYSNQNLSDELRNLKLLYIDFNKTNREQENQLRGKLDDLFGKKIHDTKAALDCIFRLFKDVELTYNQKSTARLSDKSKQVKSQDINRAISIITTKSKAFQFWRDHKRDIAIKLGIRPFEQDTFEMNFSLAFDFFKSQEEAEHRKILFFVKGNYTNCQGFTEDECIDELFCKFNKVHSTNFDDKTLKAIIYAAYFESINKTDN